MDFKDRLKKLRKIESLTQEEFAERSGIGRSSISELESGKRKPTKQIIKKICRAFEVNRDWLEHGEGEKYDRTINLSDKGAAIRKAIDRALISPDRKIPLSLAAKVVGIDPDNPSRKFPMPKEYWDAIYLLVQIFEEGNKERIDAVMSLFKALKPPLTKKEILEKLKEGAI